MAITINGSGRIDGVTEVNNAIPPGTVIHVCTQTAPAGWLKANGAAVSRSTYATLFAAIGTTFGAGDGTTTFTLPDLRGEFIRGFDDGRGVDTGRALGSAQTDALQNITGSVAADTGASSGIFTGPSGAFGVTGGTSLFVQSGGATGFRYTGLNIDASRVARTGTETRPRNVALLACIKY